MRAWEPLWPYCLALVNVMLNVFLRLLHWQWANHRKRERALHLSHKSCDMITLRQHTHTQNKIKKNMTPVIFRPVFSDYIWDRYSFLFATISSHLHICVMLAMFDTFHRSTFFYYYVVPWKVLLDIFCLSLSIPHPLSFLF